MLERKIISLIVCYLVIHVQNLFGIAILLLITQHPLENLKQRTDSGFREYLVCLRYINLEMSGCCQLDSVELTKEKSEKIC